MESGQHQKRRAEEQSELPSAEAKKQKTTPRPRTTPRSTRRMSAGDSDSTQRDDNKSMFEDLKKHFDRSNDAAMDRFERLFGLVDARVSNNTNAIAELRDAVKRIEANQTTPQCPPPPSNYAAPKDSPNYKRDRYEAARKMVRLWPVNGKSDGELRLEALRFIRQKLRVCTISCNDEQVLKVRRTKQAKKSIINHEVLVFFSDKYSRDQVVANAKNLAEYRLPDGRPTAGMRMNYPDHLTADFRALEWYGAELNKRYPGTKRNIKFDDDSEGLRMDVRVPHMDEWHKVYPEMAREIKSEKSSENASRTRTVLETPPLLPPSAPRNNVQPPIGLLTGGNSVLKAPVLSSAAMAARADTIPLSQTTSDTAVVNHDPNEIIYISPKKRTTST